MARWLSPLLSLFGVIHLAGVTCASPPPADPTHLQVNVLVGMNGASAFQCWAVDPPFTISQQAGTIGARIQNLGNSTSSTVVFFNQTHDIDAGLHQAPDPQWVFVLLGSGVVTLPTTNASIALPTGNIIIAADTADVSKIGHETMWTAGTVVIQMPFKDRVVPGHKIINASGPCPDPANDDHTPHHPHGGHSHGH